MPWLPGWQRGVHVLKIPYNGNRHTGIRFARTAREAFGQEMPLRPFKLRRASDVEWDPERVVVGPICIFAAAVLAVLMLTGAV